MKFCSLHPKVPVIVGRTLCKSCLDYRKSRYHFCVSNGFCTSHPPKPALPGNTKCAECVQKRRARFRNRVDAGLCFNHPDRKAVVGKSGCEECLWKLIKSGWSKDTYSAQYRKQRGCCAVCGRKAPRQHSAPNPLVGDHCHKTKKVRGLLCNNCNSLIGRFGDDPAKILDFASRVAKYLGTDWSAK